MNTKTKYEIGDLVLVSLLGVKQIFELDGVRHKLHDGKLTVSYESGETHFHENEVVGRVTLEKPKQTRTRKPKTTAQMDMTNCQEETLQ